MIYNEEHCGACKHSGHCKLSESMNDLKLDVAELVERKSHLKGDVVSIDVYCNRYVPR